MSVLFLVCPQEVFLDCNNCFIVYVMNFLPLQPLRLQIKHAQLLDDFKCRDLYMYIELFKKLIQFLECSWNHEYFGSRPEVFTIP